MSRFIHCRRVDLLSFQLDSSWQLYVSNSVIHLSWLSTAARCWEFFFFYFFSAFMYFIWQQSESQQHHSKENFVLIPPTKTTPTPQQFPDVKWVQWQRSKIFRKHRARQFVLVLNNLLTFRGKIFSVCVCFVVWVCCIAVVVQTKTKFAIAKC